ncbi:CotH kinase family protein [Myroides sp. WP-1]|uniref:CotH kinase family protein n=1 Tax=Myroides sp. WP-1 TaxID=2759944 RepID=UPI0015FB5084|nr:CotH kinase family protein [Myroides sp. WP-1]MBB1139002.1 CotH kinase family protein [Myroides sp. WP-1]
MIKNYCVFIAFCLTSTLFGQQIDPPTFSANSGFYDQAFLLQLQHPNANATVLYTLDGSEPSLDNVNGKVYSFKTKYPQHGGQLPFEMHQDTLFTLVYQTPISVYDRSTEANRLATISTTYEYNPYVPTTLLDKSFVVRAKAYVDADRVSETVTKVYFVAKNYPFPVVNINVDDDLLFSYEKGLWVAGKTFDDWRLDNPLVDNYETTVPANYWAKGSASEVPVNFIYLDNGSEVVNQTVGIRNHGNGSRHFKNRSYRLYAKADYGKKQMEHSFFANYPYDSFKRLIVRNSGNDTYRTMFRDAFIQKLNEHLHFETQKYQPVVTFVNGEYYGLMNLRERYDEKYFERVYNIKEKDLDFLENNGVVEVGDSLKYAEMVTFFQTNNLNSTTRYNQALTYIDEVNFTDYQIAEIYAANFDWPHNNNTYFRKRVAYTPNAPFGQDGRFRWVFKDLDAGFNGIDEWINNSYNHNTLASAIASEDHILSGLLSNTTYKNYFLNRFADMLNTTYKQQRVLDLIDVMRDNISAEMPRYIERWNLIQSMQDWDNRIEQLKEFTRLRTNYQYQHLHAQFNLSGNYQLTAQINNQAMGFVKVNTIEINNSTIGVDDDYDNWKGTYFKGVPITLEAVALPGYKFSHWTGDRWSLQQKITVTPYANFKIKAVFRPDFSVGDIDRVAFILYPNPATDVLNITSNSDLPVTYRIFDYLGQTIQEGTLVDQKIQVSQFNRGIYLIELKQNGQKVVKRFIKK